MLLLSRGSASTLLLGTCFILSACGGAAGGSTLAAQSADSSIPLVSRSTPNTIFAANTDGNTVTVYSTSANGNAPPIATIGGNNTGISLPYDVTLDASGNFYVANGAGGPQGIGSITFYQRGSNGNVRPTRTIAGSNTGLNTPITATLDPSGNLYVVNNGASSVTIYGPKANGNIAPTRMIGGNNTQMSGPEFGAIDEAGNLYVTQAGNASVNIYGPGANGNVSPIGVLAGSNTGLVLPTGASFDANGNLWIANEFAKGGGNVLEFPPGARGNVSPINSISGGDLSKTSGPVDVAIGPSGSIYVCIPDPNDPGSSFIDVFAKNATGAATPLASISGSNTGLSLPDAVASGPFASQ